MSSPKEKLLLLDTHIWIWLINGATDKLSANCVSACEQASSAGQLGICAISIWEIGMLEAKGRIRFNRSCLDWVRAALKAPGTLLLPLTPEIAVESSRLPGELHGDPADRLIAATARILDATLVTQDKKLIEYGNQHFLSVLPG